MEIVYHRWIGGIVEELGDPPRQGVAGIAKVVSKSGQYIVTEGFETPAHGNWYRALSREFIGESDSNFCHRRDSPSVRILVLGLSLEAGKWSRLKENLPKDANLRVATININVYNAAKAGIERLL